MVTAIHEPDVLDGFRLPDAGGGDGSLLSVALQYGQRLFVDLQRDDALGTNQVRPKGRALGPSAFLGIEIKRDTALGLIASMDLVPDDESDAFVARPDIRLGRRSALDEDGRFAGGSRTSEEGRKIESVSAQDPKVQSAATLILLPAHPDFLELADLSVRDELLYGLEDGVVAIAMRDGEPHALVGAELHDLVGFGQGTDERLLDIDALHAGFDRGDDHVPMLMDMTRTDGRDVGLRLPQHDLVVGVGLHATEPLGRVRQALGVGIRDRHDLSLGELQPDGIFSMPVVTLAGVPDDPDGQGSLRRLGRQRGDGKDQGDKEDAAFHVTWWSEGS